MAFPTPYSSNYTIRPDGTRVSEASVPDLVTPSAQPTNDDWLQKILDRTEEMYEREERGPYPAYRPMPSMGSKGTKAISGRRSLADSGHNQSPQEKELDALSMLAKRKQLEAMMGTAPQRMTTFASGAINGYVNDPSQMNGFQREIFLPNNSGALADGLSDGQIQGMSPAGAANSWEAKTAQNPNSVENQSGPSQYELMRVIQQLQAQLSGGR
jgi:hypothetical protein